SSDAGHGQLYSSCAQLGRERGGAGAVAADFWDGDGTYAHAYTDADPDAYANTLANSHPVADADTATNAHIGSHARTHADPDAATALDSGRAWQPGHWTVRRGPAAHRVSTRRGIAQHPGRGWHRRRDGIEHHGPGRRDDRTPAE